MSGRPVGAAEDRLFGLRAAEGAIEKKLMSSVRDISRIITKARTRDEDQREKYDSMVENLIGQGYDPSSIDTILKYAANHLWRD
ncbi:MAG: hypothetical protein R3C97_03265 [Geminicoccaceae bacterium]